MVLKRVAFAAGALLVSVLLSLPMARGQPFRFDAAPLQPAPSEAAQRVANDYQGFTFDFSTATAAATPNGALVSNQVAQNPFLSTLPGEGNGQTLVKLGPCASNTPHTHPRGSEISFVLYGDIQFGMVEESANGHQLVLRNISENTTIHIPQGLLHFSYNPHCTPAAFLANFATKDPGTQTMWTSLFTVPSYILAAASGLNEGVLQSIQRLPQVVAPGTGGEECLRRCGLDFQAANKFTAPLLQDSASTAHAMPWPKPQPIYK